MIRSLRHKIRLVASLCTLFFLAQFVQAADNSPGTELRNPQSVIEPKIVGGINALPNEFPWIVRISRAGFGIWCGGSVIGERWVLTAAHCVDANPASEFAVTAGDHNVALNEGTEQTRNVNRIVLHPGWNSSSFSNDIALLQLETPLALDSTVGPVTIGALPAIGTNLMVAGWGNTSEGGVTSNILQKVSVPIVSDTICSNTLNIDETMFCAGSQGGGVDSCQGDSGGPIFTVTTLPGNEQLVGLVSWGIGCARPDFFGVYNESFRYRSWINRIIKASWSSVATNDPEWSDVKGWGDISNYSVIQGVGAGENLYLLARANAGVITLRYDFANDRWVRAASNDPEWSDAKGWDDVTNYSTIQAVAAGDDLFLIARANAGVVTLRLNQVANRWDSIAANDPEWSDVKGWGDISNYSVIQGVGAGENLYLLARANAGVITLRYDSANDRWVRAASNDPEWSDAKGWDDVTNYSTIQAVAAGDDLFLIARANAGVVALRLNQAANRWDSIAANDPGWSDVKGWGDISNYSVIQGVGAGENLYLLARANAGVITLRYDFANDRWVRAASNDPEWSDAKGWDDVTNYSTIQAVAAGDDLFLIARANAGVVTLRLNQVANRWDSIAANDPEWSDVKGWGDISNYSVIQGVGAGENLYLLARADAGIITLRLLAD